MLNELAVIEKALRRAGFGLTRRHPSIKDTRRMSTLVVELGEDGSVEAVRPLPQGCTAWTMRDGQHNSFPFVQPRNPLWTIAPEETVQPLLAVAAKHTDLAARRDALLGLRLAASLNTAAATDCSGAGLLRRLRDRVESVSSIEHSPDAQVLWDATERFLLACDKESGGNPVALVEQIVDKLLSTLEQVASQDWVDVAARALLGKQQGDAWVGDAALLFDAAGGAKPIYDLLVADAVSAQLSDALDAESDEVAECALTGQQLRLVTGNFPQPNLPELGQTWLFAKNRDIPANDRYGMVGSKSIPVGEQTVMDLQAALLTLADPERKNVTWRPIPAEREGRDLLLAYAEGRPDYPAADLIAGTPELSDDLADDEDDAVDVDEPVQDDPLAQRRARARSIDHFRRQAEKLVAAVDGKALGDPDHHRVRMVILRRVDPANRKVVYSGAPTAGELYRAALDWADGEGNLPPWLRLPVPVARGTRARIMPPPHIAPLGLTDYSRVLFVRHGTERQKVFGLPAAEALRLLFIKTGGVSTADLSCIHRWLRLTLRRRGALLSGVAHGLHRPADSVLAKYDRHEALRALSVLGVLLHKLNRDWRVFMSGAAYRMGQLLAAADIVHAGYCADVRKGSLPPSLLGNQVFTMAQSDPATALATLCRRWKPYAGWVSMTSHETGRIQALIHSKQPGDEPRGWAIRQALRVSRDMASIAGDLAEQLLGCKIDDVFRAELLLGYMAGLPRAARKQDGYVTGDPAGGIRGDDDPETSNPEEV